MASADTLFGEYAFGMKKADVHAKSRAVPCADEPDNRLSLCAPAPVDYLQQHWQQKFSFNNLDELQQVILEQPNAKSGQWQAILSAMVKSGWQPVFLETDDGAFDVLEQARQYGLEKETGLQGEFAQDAMKDAANLTISLFPAAYYEKILADKKIKNFAQATDKAAETMCVPRMMINDNYIKLAFTAPLLSRKNALRYGQMIKRN